MKRILILPLISSGLCYDSHAFSSPSPPSIGGGTGSVEPKDDAAARRIVESSSENGEELSKLEKKSVQRFTTGYDKLCKTCPALLLPRVDTLTEMIIGLTDAERVELMSNVARRLDDEVGATSRNERTTDTKRGIQSSMDTYNFQTSACMQVQLPTEPKKPKNSSSQKLIRKMEKARGKFEYNRRKVARARRLLACCNALLARDRLANEPTIYTLPNPLDSDIYHDIDELKKLSRQELKLERLKLDAQKARFESKVKKGRLKLYGASRALIMTAT